MDRSLWDTTCNFSKVLHLEQGHFCPLGKPQTGLSGPKRPTHFYDPLLTVPSFLWEAMWESLQKVVLYGGGGGVILNLERIQKRLMDLWFGTSAVWKTLKQKYMRQLKSLKSGHESQAESLLRVNQNLMRSHNTYRLPTGTEIRAWERSCSL